MPPSTLAVTVLHTSTVMTERPRTTSVHPIEAVPVFSEGLTASISDPARGTDWNGVVATRW
jgi:hypothetical protein